MTALAANVFSTKTKPRGITSVIVTNAATIYVGSGVGLTTAGRASPWADTAGMEWLGVHFGSRARNLPANAGGKVVGDTSYSPPHEAEVNTSGVLLLGVPVAGASAQADVGSRVYSSTDNLLTDLTLTPTTNVKSIGKIVRYNSATSFDVQLFTPQEYQGQELLADITALTDSSGGGATDGTIGAVTAPTALTDNGGGTADGTVASQAAPVTLTDNSGGSGTHDDTLAAVTTFTPSVAWDGATVFPSAADATAIATAITVLNQNASDTAQKVIELVTLGTTAQNNLKELTTAQGQNRTAIVALTDAVAELAAKVNEIIADLNLGN